MRFRADMGQRRIFFVNFAWYTILSKNLHTNRTSATQNLQGTIQNCMNHPRQRDCQSSRKQSRRRCLNPLQSTTRLSGVDGSMSGSYNLKSTLPSSSMDVLLWTTSRKASYSMGRSTLFYPRTTTPSYMSRNVFRRSMGIKVRPFPIDSLWLRPVRDVVLPFLFTWWAPLISYGSRSRHDTSQCGNGYKWPSCAGMAKTCRIRGRVEEPWSGTHRLCIHSSCVDRTSWLHERGNKAISPPECVSASRRCQESRCVRNS